jgi:archaellum component FlaF (FlaF/FlaG flagellin family)
MGLSQLDGGWKLLSSATASGGGAEISTPGYDTASWLNVKPDDGGAAGTEISALLQNGSCPNIFFSDNMRKCFGSQDQWSPVSNPQFKVPWWFRTDFTTNLAGGKRARLIVSGIVGEADIWVNGRQLASRAEVQGTYPRYMYDIGDDIRPGANVVALKLYPNDPSAMFTVDHVDWTPAPPDNNTGIKFPVQLEVADVMSVSDAHVVQTNASDMSSSGLTVKATVTNNSSHQQNGSVVAIISPPDGGAAIRAEQRFNLFPGKSQTVVFAPAAYPQLRIARPKVWWPYQMGDQPQYGLDVSVTTAGRLTGWSSERFAIRTVTSHLTGKSGLAPDGVRAFAINGRPFLFRGGGWDENLFLTYSARDTANQVALIKNLGLNGIRLEGHEMPDDFYAQMDRAGIMIDAGFTCCDKWQPQADARLTDHEVDILRRSALSIGQRLRNHASVINYGWSDFGPAPRQERVTMDAFNEADFHEPVISSADFAKSPINGPSGEKEGPYDWVPPTYWYDTEHFSGGAWGFGSEQSAGMTIPTLSSLKRFLSPADLSSLWRDQDLRQYHTNYEGLSVPKAPVAAMDLAIEKRYGPWSSLESFVMKAQVQNYEVVRAQFEAFIAHSRRTPIPSTGLVYWQLNKGWPTLLWDLYNNDYDLSGSYFGAKKANRTLHALYAYDTKGVAVANLTGKDQADLAVEVRVRDASGKVIDDQRAGGIRLSSQDVREVVRPRLATAPPVQFVDVVLKQHGVPVDRNVYWLSPRMDEFPWEAGGFPVPGTPMTHYADLTSLQNLATARVTAVATTHQQDGPTGRQDVTSVTVTNPATSPSVAFFLRADIVRDNAPTEPEGSVLPATWSENYVALWPGESQTLVATYDDSALRGGRPVARVDGWNVPAFTAGS